MPTPAWLKRRVGDAWTIPTLDLLFVLLMILLLLPHSRAEELSNPPPGTLIAEIQWSYEDDIDVDLWLHAPGARSAIGYSNKGGLIWNLLRDDLGSTVGDISEANYEVTYSRGVPDGEYQLNIHLYRAHTPPPVRVAVVVKLNNGNSVVRLFQKLVTLTNIGQETTVFRWMMLDGAYVAGSKHDIPKSIRRRHSRGDGF